MFDIAKLLVGDTISRGLNRVTKLGEWSEDSSNEDSTWSSNEKFFTTAKSMTSGILFGSVG